jgi:hypothetical protein
MLRRVALVRAEVSEERIASIIRATRIGKLFPFRNVLRLLVTANVVRSSCHSDDGGNKFLRNVGTYNSHTA